MTVKNSIRNRLLVFCLLSVVLLVAVSIFALFEIVSLGRLTNRLDTKWVKSTAILGETSDLITEVRLGETLLSLAGSPAETAAALSYNAEQVRALEEEHAEYQSTDLSPPERMALATFDREWGIWASQHAAWVALPSDQRALAGAAYQERADALYHKADNAIDALVAVNAAGAEAAAYDAASIVRASRQVFLMAVLIALGLATWAVVMIRQQISKPLASITGALAALAGGDRSVAIPERKSDDEIGTLARAFEVFRANAFALEKAHEAAEAAQLRAQALARHDPLTGLTNRRVLSEDLERTFGRVDRSNSTFALLLFDLDGFKPINDRHGHPAGDAVLCEISARLKDVVRKTDTLSRIGGDEFAIVCDLEARSPQTSEEIIVFAGRVLDAVHRPVQFEDVELQVNASVGIAFGPSDGGDAETLLRAADIAMYRAKQAGGGAFRFYEPSMDEELRTRATLEADLRAAVAKGEIKPYYQPLVDLKSGSPIGFEVLARWHHPEKGDIAPSDFIPIIEQLGLIGEFTWSILRRSCIDARAWPPHLDLSVNVSPIQLKEIGFPAHLLAILQETGFPPGRLEIEITETALLTDLEVVKANLEAVQRLGVKVALDDFGTGYSSLYHLRELKLDKIKIDRSFVQSLLGNRENEKIVNAILGLAQSLDLPTTAEGIESDEVLQRLNLAGCNVGQGYLFGRAMPAGDVAAWIGAGEIEQRMAG